MGVAHTYAELKSSVLKLKDELKFVATGRLIAEVIIIAGGEPRLRIGDHQLSEEHAGRLARWIQRCSNERSVIDREPFPVNLPPTRRASAQPIIDLDRRRAGRLMARAVPGWLSLPVVW